MTDSGNAASVVDIQAGADHTLVLLSSGRVLGFGDNAFGVLGLGKTIKSVSTPTDVPGLTTARQISTGTWHSCAIDAEAKALCWGRNFGGALGNGSNAEKSFAPPTPVVDLSSAAEIRAGGSYTCVRSTDGAASCWGLVVSGTVARPARVPKLDPVAKLSVAQDRACALGRDGAAYCWGVALGLDFDYGAAIDGRDGNVKPATRVARLTNVEQIAVSATHACARTREGELYCWGFGAEGALGTGAAGEKYALTAPPKKPVMIDATDVVTGHAFTCAVTRDAAAKCWGSNRWGQLGLADKKAQLMPVAVPGLTGIERLAAGDSHVCALSKDGRVACWGKNTAGQLGDGTSGAKESKSEPVRLRIP
jgi:alpha-tubulin suppressor-like RCC1 family protein